MFFSFNIIFQTIHISILPVIICLIISWSLTSLSARKWSSPSSSLSSSWVIFHLQLQLLILLFLFNSYVHCFCCQLCWPQQLTVKKTWWIQCIGTAQKLFTNSFFLICQLQLQHGWKLNFILCLLRFTSVRFPAILKVHEVYGTRSINRCSQTQLTTEWAGRNVFAYQWCMLHC